jgi:hypothetical protein
MSTKILYLKIKIYIHKNFDLRDSFVMSRTVVATCLACLASKQGARTAACDSTMTSRSDPSCE